MNNYKRHNRLKPLSYPYDLKSGIIIFVIVLLFNNCNTDYGKILSGGYIFEYKAGHNQAIMLISSRSGDKYIPCDVIAYAFNEEYIIAAQNRVDDCCWGDSIPPWADKGQINFWIIAHKTNEFIGPLSLEEYIGKRIELSIPDNLKMSVYL